MPPFSPVEQKVKGREHSESGHNTISKFFILEAGVSPLQGSISFFLIPLPQVLPNLRSDITWGYFLPSLRDLLECSRSTRC